MLQLFIASLFVVYCNGGALSGGYGGVISSGPVLSGSVLSGGYGGGLGSGLVSGGYGGGLAAGGGGLGYGSLRAGLGGYGLGNGLVLGNGLGLGGLSGGPIGVPVGPIGPIAPLAPLAAAPIAVAPNFPVNAAIQSRRTFEVRPVVLPQEPVQPSLIEVEPQELPVQIVFRSVSSPVLVQQIHTPGAPAQVESTQSEEEPQRVIHEVLRPVIQEVREVIQPFRRVTQEVRPVLEEVHTVVAKGEGRPRPVYPVPAAYPVPAPYPAPAPEILTFEPIGAPYGPAVGGPALAYDAPILAGPVGPGPVGYGAPVAGPAPYSKYGGYSKARAAKAARA